MKPQTAFDVWAPKANRVQLQLDGDKLPMRALADGWWTPEDRLEAKPGQRYGFVLDDTDDARPDPRSLRQPDGVHGLSEVFDLSAYTWSDTSPTGTAWTGRQLPGSMIYELHLGTFTPEGTLDSAITKLPHLAELGVQFIELMPVNSFNGGYNWGYDGVDWFAVSETYGGPESYQRFVDAAHAAGLGVIQDVVYNHLGPSGNYLPLFGPYLTSGKNTWGDLLNLDGEGSAEVRRFILDNASMWFRDFHVDGLRLDAVHALKDDSPVHLLEQMAIETQAVSAQLNRPCTLIAESDLNDPKLVTPREGGGYGLDAQWSDDFHHALHVALTGETTGYYADFEPLSALAKVCTEAFFHNGTYSSFRGANHGVPVDTVHTPSWRFVVCSQNHDQVGNRAQGDRLTEHLNEGQLKIAALMVLCGPFTPMLFMGEEFAASTPFQFFTNHPEPELAKVTAEGRIEEFAQMGWDPAVVPDPQDRATFERSRLRWDEARATRGADVLAFYRRLGRLRRSVPELTDPHFPDFEASSDEMTRVFRLRRGAVDLIVNFGAVDASFPTDFDRVELDSAEVLASTTGESEVPGNVLPAHSGYLVRYCKERPQTLNEK